MTLLKQMEKKKKIKPTTPSPSSLYIFYFMDAINNSYLQLFACGNRKLWLDIPAFISISGQYSL